MTRLILYWKKEAKVIGLEIKSAAQPVKHRG